MISLVLSYLPYSTFLLVNSHLSTPVQYTGLLLEPLNTSTITVGGKLSNIQLHEKDDIHKFVPSGNIVMTGSNYLEQLKPGFVMPVKKVKTTNRGRKRKVKPQKKRIQGSGKYFNSQITFVVQSESDRTKLYKCKVFRNGAFQVPGCKTTDLVDLQQPLNDLQQYFCNIYNNPKIEVAHTRVDMRNCKTRLVEYNLCINTTELGRIIEAEMRRNKKLAGKQKQEHDAIDAEHTKRVNRSTDNMRRVYEAGLKDLKDDDDVAEFEKKYVAGVLKMKNEELKRCELKKLTAQINANRTNAKDDIGIYNVEYQTAQNSSKVIVKFLRPVAKKPFKTTTLKVLKQKVNFEGAISFEDIQNIYQWLNSLLIEHYDSVIYDPAVEQEREDILEQKQRDDNASDSDSSGKRIIVLSSDDEDESDDDSVPVLFNRVDHDRYMENPYDED